MNTSHSWFIEVSWPYSYTSDRTVSFATEKEARTWAENFPHKGTEGKEDYAEISLYRIEFVSQLN